MPRDGALVEPGNNKFTPWLLEQDAKRRKAQIPAARRAAAKIAPHLDQLARRMFHWMDQPRCSQNIRCQVAAKYCTTFQWLGSAIVCPWLMLDSWNERTVILIDVDHADAQERAAVLVEHYGLPMPTIVADPYTGRAHVCWLLATPVLVETWKGSSPRAKPQALFEAVGHMLATAMGGTLMPYRALAKSPWGLTERLQGELMHREGQPATPAVWEAHEASGSPLVWVTYPGDLVGVELTDIVRALGGEPGEDRSARKIKAASRRPELAGRHVELFDRLRLWAYPRREGNEAKLVVEARRINATLVPPLPDCDLRATARSIGKFVRWRYRPKGHAVASEKQAGARPPRPRVGRGPQRRDLGTGHRKANDLRHQADAAGGGPGDRAAPDHGGAALAPTAGHSLSVRGAPPATTIAVQHKPIR
jgi:hypothetical protein